MGDTTTLPESSPVGIDSQSVDLSETIAPSDLLLPSSEVSDSSESSHTADQEAESQPYETFYSPTRTISDDQQSQRQASATETSSKPVKQNLFSFQNAVFRNIIYLSAISVIVIVALIVTYCTLKQTQQPTEEKFDYINVPSEKGMTEVFGILMSSNKFSFANHTGLTTVFDSGKSGLAIPAYLLVNYDTSVRPKHQIAKGGFGCISIGEALDLPKVQSGSPIVIKELMNSERGLTSNQLESFYQEVSIMAYLTQHRNIAKIYAYTETPHTIIMKYYPLGSLEGWILSRTTTTISQMFYFAQDIAYALEYLNEKGFCHADLKPQNILLDIDYGSNTTFCVLTDFGISQLYSRKALLVKAFNPVIINGASIAYAAPEALLKVRLKEHVPPEIFPKFDIYSYSIVLYELVCRKSVRFE